MSTYFLIDGIQLHSARAGEARVEALSRITYLVIDRAGRLFGTLFDHARSAVRFVRRSLASWQDRQAALRELSKLDDRMLRDIGLSRGQIEAAVRGTLPETGPEFLQPKTAPASRTDAPAEPEIFWRRAA